MLTKEYDYVIAGAGLYGAVFAYEATKRGFTCLVMESRNHIGGNCYTRNVDGVNVHEYGPHIFHTNSKEIWDYINQFAEFNNFVYRPKVRAQDHKLYSFPINLMTLYQVYGCKTPEQARKAVARDIKPMINDNLEEWAISQVGTKLYELFIKGYTTKQWGRDPKELPSSIIKRLPIRYTFDDNYFNDRYQGIPIGGYTQIFEKMLTKSEVLLGRPFESSDRRMAKRKVVFTGPIDAYFKYKLGTLQYRSLRFTHTSVRGDFQGNAVINHPGLRDSCTRVIEHKHFDNPDNPTSIVTAEFPQEWNKTLIPYYPINTDINQALYKQYKELADKDPKLLMGGRLATYKYFDMHQIIGMALKDVRVEFGEN